MEDNEVEAEVGLLEEVEAEAVEVGVVGVVTEEVVEAAAAGAAVAAVMDVAEVLLEAAGPSEGVGAPHP